MPSAQTFLIPTAPIPHMPSITAKDVKKGDWLRIKGEVVRVIRKEVVACGTHSHSKPKFYCKGLMGGGERSYTFNHADKLEQVEVLRKQGQLVSKGSTGTFQVMDARSYEMADAIAKDEELAGALQEGDDVLFVQLEGQSVIIERRAAQEGGATESWE